MLKETEKEDEDDIEMEGSNYNHPKCHICHKYQKNPFTTKHCGACNKCIDGFDHHCGWLNTSSARRTIGVSGVTGERLDADLGAVFGGRLVVSRDLGEVEKGGKSLKSLNDIGEDGYDRSGEIDGRRWLDERRSCTTDSCRR